MNLQTHPFPFKIIDLTHIIKSDIPTWNGHCGFQCKTQLDHQDWATGVNFRVQQLHIAASIGTHLDAPAHCILQGATIDQIPVSNLVAPCVMIDVSALTHAHYQLSVQEILQFEALHGYIEAGSFVMIKTGWEKFWDTPEKYRNNCTFPSISLDAAQLLLDRQIVGIGIDTLSPDAIGSDFPVHQLLLGAGKYIVENAAHLEQLPTIGSFILILPLKIKDGAEAPIRLLGFLS